MPPYCLSKVIHVSLSLYMPSCFGKDADAVPCDVFTCTLAQTLAAQTAESIGGQVWCSGGTRLQVCKQSSTDTMSSC